MDLGKGECTRCHKVTKIAYKEVVVEEDNTWDIDLCKECLKKLEREG